MLWLVRLYFERGEQDKATALAERVAEVGSFWGVVTRASLHDWRGELEEAERDHRRAWRRYDNPNELLGFYLRHDRKGSEVEELLHNVFPTGVTRAAAPVAGSPPADGALIVHPGAFGATHGLRAGDVVLAVDGIRVRNFSQYRAARAASVDDVMRLSVWRAGKHLDIAAPLRHSWVVSTIRTYDPSTRMTRQHSRGTRVAQRVTAGVAMGILGFFAGGLAGAGVGAAVDREYGPLSGFLVGGVVGAGAGAAIGVLVVR